MKALYRALALVLISYGLARAQTVTGGGGSGNVSDGGTNGGVYRDSSGALHASATGGAGTLCFVSSNGGAPVFGSCAGTPSTAWDSLTAPSGNLAIAMGLNLTAFTWAGNTSTNNLFSLKDTTGNTGTGSLLEVHTVGTSSAKPVTFTAKGTANGVQMDNTGALAKIGTGSIAADSMAVGGLTGLGTGVGTWFATPSGANLASALTTSLPASKGGTGVANTATLTLGSSNQNWATLGTGIVKNTTTTGAISDAASADVYGLWSGTCNSTTFLRGDGACATPSGSGTVTVSGGGSLTTTAFMTGVGTTVSQTPSATSTLDSSGNAAFAGTVTATGGVASGSSPPSSSVCTSGTAGSLCAAEGTTPTGTLLAVGVLWQNSSGHRMELINNNSTSSPVLTAISTDILTNKAFDSAGSGNSLSINGLAATANTGTGSVVRAASPTFTGTVTAAAITASGAFTNNGSYAGSAVVPTANIALALANQTSIHGITAGTAAGDATLGQVIAHGATAVDFASTATGACATLVTATATGAASTDTIIFNANASIKAVTGYVPASTGGFSISAFPTTNTVSFEGCNWTAGTVDPGSITVNWVVIR